MFEQILPLTKVLVALPTVVGDVKYMDLILEIVHQELSEFKNTKYFKDSPSIIYYNTDNQTAPFKIILNANLDVVPGKASQFKPYEEDGKLYGRGAYDVKTAAAAMILVFKEVAKKVKYPLAIQLTTDEESGQLGTKYQIEQGIKGKFVISAIPTDLGISYMSKGMLWIRVASVGKRAHAAYPWKGENAIWKMKKFLDALEKAFPIPQEDSWVTTATLSKIQSTNKTINSIPDQCEVFLDIRYIPEDEKTIVGKIEALIPKDLEREILLNDQPEYTSLENPYLIKLSESFEKITKSKPRIFKKHIADAVRYYNAIGGSGVCFGPTGAGAHEDDEWVDIRSAETYYKTLKEFLLSLNEN